jgi:hypothetical protein
MEGKLLYLLHNDADLMKCVITGDDLVMQPIDHMLEASENFQAYQGK